MTQQPESAELLPCPFCKGKAIERFQPFYIQCQDCRSCTRIRRTIKEAREAWNTRPTASAHADEAVKLAIEALEVNARFLRTMAMSTHGVLDAETLTHRALTTLKRLGGQQ